MSDLMTEEPAPAEEEDRPEPRHLPPFLYPVLGLLFGGLLVFSFSRVLLAVSEIESVDLGFREVSGKTVTAVIALFVSMNVLVGAALVAYGRRVRGIPASWPLLAAATGLVVAGGVLAIGLGEPEGEGGGGGGGVPPVRIAAVNIAFDKAELALPADAPVRIEFDNRDAGAQHNVAIYTDESAAEVIFSGEITTGPAVTTYEVDPLPAGQYFFRCDVHPTQMTGTVNVAQGGGGGGGGPGEGGPGGAALTAQNTQFDRAELTVPSGGEVTISFNNMDAVPHNVAVYTDDSATEAIFTGDLVTGPMTVQYTFEAPDPGEYFFRCDVHPTVMTGTLIVE